MTIPVTGPISMTMLCNEIGISTSSISLNYFKLRILAGKQGSGTIIKYSDFKNKFRAESNFGGDIFDDNWHYP